MSVTIIDRTIARPSKFVYTEVPDFSKMKHGMVEQQKFFEKEMQRFAEGYFIGHERILTGMHYFYLTQIWLKTGLGEYIRPTWRDVDDMIFEMLDDCYRNKIDGFIMKRREVGLTSICSGGVGFYVGRMMPGVTINMTSADTNRFTRMFNDKVAVAYDMMDERLFNSEPANFSNTKKSAHLKIPMKRPMPDGRIVTVYTEFNLQETSQTDDSVTKFSSSRTPYMFIDEIFLHPRVNRLLDSVVATMRSQTKKIGFFIGGGTCEDTVTREQLRDFKKFWDGCDAMGIRKLFVEAFWGLVTENGWSDERAGNEWIDKEIEKFEKAGYADKAQAFRKNYPKTLEDIFAFAEGDGAFEKDVTQILEHALTEAVKQDHEKPYKLLPQNGGIEAIPDTKIRGKNDGGFWMIEPPQDGQKYYQCIDGAASGKEDGAEEGSWIGSVIFKDISLKGDDYCPVCIYFERPNRLEDGYRNILTQYEFYDKYKGMVHINYETNAGMGGNFGTFLDNNGHFKAIMRRKDLTAKGYIDTNKLGTAVDDNIKENLMLRANPFLRRKGSQFRSKLMLAQLLLPKDQNADLRSAFLIFMASIADWDKPKKVKEKPRVITRMELVQTPQGTRWKQVKINTSGEHDNTHLPEITVFIADMKKKYATEYWWVNMTAEEKATYAQMKGAIPT